MSTIKSDNSNLILNADGAGSEVKFHNNGVEICKVDATGFSGNGIPTELNDLSDVTVTTSDPTTSSNKPVGHLWINKTSGEQFVATNATTGANVWTNTGAGSGDVVPTYTASYLVIAGGAGGCSSYGGGGGAGGYRSSYSNETSGGGGSAETSIGVSPGSIYTITVGGGGAGGTGGDGSNGVSGVNGSNSVLSGSGITTITSVGCVSSSQIISAVVEPLTLN